MSPLRHRLEPHQRAVRVEDHRAVLGRPLLGGEEDVVAVGPRIGILLGDLHRRRRQVGPRLERQLVPRHPARGRQRRRRNRSRRRRDREVERSRRPGAEDVQPGPDRDHLAGHERLGRQEAPALPSESASSRPAWTAAPRARHDHLAHLADRQAAERDLRLRRGHAVARDREHADRRSDSPLVSTTPLVGLAADTDPPQPASHSPSSAEPTARARPPPAGDGARHPRAAGVPASSSAATRPHTPPRIQIRAPSG